MFRFLLVFALFGAATVLVLASCSKKPEPLVSRADVNAQETGRPELPVTEIVQELQGVKYTHSKEGKLQWELEARSVSQALDGPTNVKQVEITYYADDGKVTVLTADSGVYQSSSGDVSLRGNVVVNVSDGSSLRTEVMRWNQKEETLRGEGAVTLSRGDSVLRGDGFELSPAHETFKIYDVEGLIRQGDITP